MEPKVGQQITAPFLPATAEVIKFEPRSGYFLLEVVLDDGHHTYKPLRITDEQLAQIQVLEQSPVALADNAEDFFFFIEAHRIRLAYQFDPQLAVSISQVDPLPHQIEAVYHYVLQSPRIRFLIADDAGAGKTIMAGLIFKELEYRRLARRVLVVAPGHLKYQWQREMKERFQESFAIVDRARMESAWGENVWEERDRCITSIDFIKQPEIQATLRSTHWDLVIVDEAHKMSAYAYRTRNRTKIDKTLRYQVGEVLSHHTNHLLFLTATPHRGDEENFRLFLDLLRPGFFAQTELLQESIESKDNPVFVRRLKEDMKRFDGTRIFPPRHVHTVPFRLTSAEAALYNGVTRYVQDYFDKARINTIRGENRSISFALMILQRRLTSSTHAIYRSLKRRKARLEELLDLPERIQQDEDYLRARNITEEELQDMAEEERDEIERRLEHLTIAENIEDVQAEIEQLEELIEQAERVRAQEVESKLVGLRDKVLTNIGDRKLLIFTEFRDTLDYLVQKLRAWGYSVVTIHGQMGMDARIEAEHDFRDKAQIMVATEAAGEGINLQFCSLMVNYDIPWNPNRLEQRMGRVHRYGQNLEVHIWNMISRDTREGQILDRLFAKLKRMRKALGSDRVFDIIGEIIPGARLDDLLKDAIFHQRRIEEIEQEIEAVDKQDAQRTLERVFSIGLATRHIDYSGLLEETLTAEENRLVPEYVEDYFLRAFRRLGGEVERRPSMGAGQASDGTYAVTSVPYDLRRWSKDYDFKVTYGQLFREYRRITFDKRYAREHAEAEFVAPGHPLLEAVNQEILTSFGHRSDAYAAFGDPEGQREGVLWFMEGEVADGTDQAASKRVFCLYQSTDGDICPVNPAILWDHEPLADANVPDEVGALLQQRDAVEDHVVTEVLFPFRQEVAERREHETHVKAKYGLRSLDYLIQESNQKILDYQARQAAGEKMEMPLLNEQRNLEELQRRREELKWEIRLERNLTVGEPRFLGAAVVVPLAAAAEGDRHFRSAGHLETTYKPRTPEPVPINEERTEYQVGADMRRDEEIEAVGMQLAMAYEREQGWHPEDVSGENHGFDVRSTWYHPDGTFADIRYIEVKARAQSGAIRLSSNEWKKARHFGEKFWLYIVTEAATDTPHLYHIQNPTAHFRMDEDVFATGFIIHEETWRERSSGRNTRYQRISSNQ
jgi:superfamily II DNA or RNA helicase